MIQFEVLGTPAPKGSSRAMNNKYTGRAQLVPSGSETNRERLRDWRRDLIDAARAASAPILRVGPCFKSAVEVEMVFLLKRPKSHYRVNGALKPWAVDARPTGKPDADKLARSTLDALTGIIFTDDALVVRLVAEKFYAEPGHEGAVITIDGPGIRICEAPLSRAGP